MPYISIELNCQINNDQRIKLIKETTGLMHNTMKKKKDVTVVQIKESPSKQWSVNSIPLSSSDNPCVYVNIKITRGTNTSREKAVMIKKTIEMLKNILGSIQETCYVVIDEISADSWGYNGLTQKYRTDNK